MLQAPGPVLARRWLDGTGSAWTTPSGRRIRPSGRWRRGPAIVCRLAAMMRQFRIHRVAAPAASALLLIVLLPGVAHAHAQLDKPTPADKATVTQPVTVVSGIFVERVNAGRQQPRRQARGRWHRRPGWRRSEQRQADGRDAGDAARVRCRTSSNGRRSRSTTASWPGHLDVHGRRRADRLTDPGDDRDTGRQRHRRADRVAPLADPVPAYAPPSAGPTPAPSAGGDTTGSGSDVVVPIIVALIVLGAGAAYLLSRRNRPTDLDVIRASAARAWQRSLARWRVGLALVAARDGRGPCPEPDLHQPAAARGLRRRRGDRGRAVVRVRHRPRRPGGATRPRPRPASLPPAWLRIGAARHRTRRLGRGSSPRGSPAGRATARSRRSSCGSTAGSAWPSSARSSGRPGTSSTRSRRSTTSAPRSSADSGPGLGTGRLPGSGSGAGRRRSASRPSSGWSSSMQAGPSTPVRRRRRLHRLHARDDGPVRARRVALAGRDLHRLVPPPRPPAPGSGSSTRTAGSPTRSFGSGLLEPGWSAADVTLVAFGVSSIIFDGLSQTQAFFDLFGAPGVVPRTLILFGVPRARGPARVRGGADGRARRDRGRVCCRSRSATSSPTT